MSARSRSTARALDLLESAALTTTGATGAIVVNPLIGIARAAAGDMAAAGALFGSSPRDRSSVEPLRESKFSDL